MNPEGEVTTSNPDVNNFVDEILFGGFNQPVAVSFTDTNELFVGERAV